jgi:hypothetical protein
MHYAQRAVWHNGGCSTTQTAVRFWKFCARASFSAPATAPSHFYVVRNFEGQFSEILKRNN